MKKLTTAALAALMITGILTAATGNAVTKTGGPVPICDPYTQTDCKILKSNSLVTRTGGPVPICDPYSQTDCKLPVK